MRPPLARALDETRSDWSAARSSGPHDMEPEPEWPAAAVCQTQAQLRAILDNAPIMIFVVDEAWRVCQVNHLVEVASGSSAEELAGTAPGDALRCIRRLDAGGCGRGRLCVQCPVRQAIADALERGLACRGLEAAVPVDGMADRVLRLSVAPVKGGGTVTALVCAEDVTELRSALDASADVAQAIPSGLLVFDQRTPSSFVLVSANRAAERLIGLDAASDVGRRAEEIWPEALSPDVVTRLRDVAGGGRLLETEVVVRSGGRASRSFLLRAFRMPRSRVGVAFEEVTEAKATEDALRESEAVLRALIESTRSPIAVLDVRHRLRAFNPAFAALMEAAHDVEAREGLCLTDALSPEAREWWLDRLQRALEGESIRDEVAWLVGGDRRTYGVSLNPVRQRGEATGVSLFARDITEYEGTEQALRLLSRRLLLAQEDERRRISCELHDEIGQLLTAVKIGLQRLGRGKEAGLRVPDVAGSVLAIDRAIEDVRRLCLDLRPPLLDELGLETALLAHAERRGRETGLAISVSTGDLRRLPLEHQIVCFRVVQEALTNVLRHSGATRASVHVSRDERQLRLAVRDDGSGFDLKAAMSRGAAERSVGLASMRERVGLVGGELTIETAPGAGTAVCAWLPVPAAESVAGDQGEERA